MRHLTTKGAADLLSGLEPYPDMQPYLAVQLRDFVARGVVKPAAFEGTGRRSALYDADSLCVARLMSWLTRLGLKAEQITEAVGRLEKAFDSEGNRAPGGYRKGGIPSAVRQGAKRGDPWFFVLRVEAAPRGVPLAPASGGFFEGERLEAHPYATCFPRAAQLGGLWHPSVVIPVTDLFAAVLNHPEFMADRDDEGGPDESGPVVADVPDADRTEKAA